ncbi:MAG: 4Fe-4S binding protein [Peptostreptococcaceae bacterium]|nr:4Fe-4S binding protein [Peptostreptococcaceae bacterium]
MRSKRLQINIIRIIFLGIFIFIMSKGSPTLWLGIFGISLVAALFFGRIFCGWICPMNTLMIGTETLLNKFNIKLKDSPKWLENGWLGWVLLIGGVLTMVVIKKLTGGEIPVLLYLLIFSVLVTLRYKPEVFHNKVCPFGILQGLIGRFAFLSKRINLDKCVGCKLCETTCPAEAIVVSPQNRKAEINPQLCHQCFNCEFICPEDAINYSRKMKVSKRP